MPFLVETPEGIYDQLGLERASVRSGLWAETTRWGGLKPGTAIRRGAPLFPGIAEEVGAPPAPKAER